METKKKCRRVSRAAFTKKSNELDKMLGEGLINITDLKVAWEIYQANHDSLKVVDAEIYDLMIEQDVSEEDLLKEMEVCEEYSKKYLHLHLRYMEVIRPGQGEGELQSIVPTGTGESNVPGKRKFKLPYIQFKIFDGNIREWLPFWSQFNKVHVDPDIDPADKIQYLLQATAPGSRARQLVESFPAVGGNYEQIVDCLKSRFGREDLQIEVYVRELLKLILSNAISSNKFDIATLYDRLETQMRALETLGVSSDKSAAMLFPLIESCLPEDILRVWQRLPRNLDFRASQNSVENLEHPKMEDKLKGLMLFLQNEVENDQRIKLASEGFGLKPVASQKESGRAGVTLKHKFESGVPTAAGLINVNTLAKKCVFCEGSHESSNCFKAQQFSFEKKKSILSEKAACFACLKLGHQARKCRAQIRCVICNRQHFPLMCPSLENKRQFQSSQSVKSAERVVQGVADKSESQVSNELFNNCNDSGHVFMQTLRIEVQGVHGKQFVRALIDTGSQRSYILQSTAKSLGLVSKRKQKIVHCLFGGSLNEQYHCCYDIKLSKGDFIFVKEFLDQPVICSDISPVFNGDWSKELDSYGIKLSDELSNFNNNGKIDMLIGSDVAGILYTGKKQVLSSGLVAVETFLGWTLMGKAPVSRVASNTMVDISLFARDASLPQLWDLDILGIRDPVERKSQMEVSAATKASFLERVKIDSEGRYEVCLPWLEGHPPLPCLYNIAKSRLQGTIAKLKKSELMLDYNGVFEEWLGEDIIEEVFEDSPAMENVYYMPHRPVVKEGSTTRIRPVFDASARSKDHPSLNQCLDKGPNVIELIPNILLRFRMGKIGVVSDIRKAFLQISVNQTDRDFLRFLWVDSQEKERIFRHKRVVFGVNSSPFLLGATIEYHLLLCLDKCESGGTFFSKETILQLLNSFYVDNCVTSVSNGEILQKFMKESIMVMNEGKFDLRGWEFLGQVDDASDSPSETAVLGLMWDKSRDTLGVSEKCLLGVNDLADQPISKRLMLSFTQRVFDPIGFTAPSTLLPKLLLQKTWKTKLAWDDPVDLEIKIAFCKWLCELHYLTQIKIPRWVHGDHLMDQKSIHVFCDASKDSYAAVIFLRGIFDGKVFIRLLAAKSRIAPMTEISIPRLELLAALIGTRLFVSLKEDLKCDSIYFWSDSSTVLSWIRRKENWGTFVGNRVAEITKYTSTNDWHFVPGVLNPADLPSRGCSPKQLLESRWWEGPSWLADEPELWPQVDNIVYREEEINKEKKKGTITTLVNSDSTLDWHLLYFSKFVKTLRMVGWIFRFLHNIKNSTSKLNGELSVGELEVAERHVFRLIQKESFQGGNDSRLCGLSPFVDEHDIIRLRSRVCNRRDAEQFRFPIVLPAKHDLVVRLIFDQHVRSLHVGTQGLMGIMREKYWVLGGRRAIRSVISRCVTCRRHRSKSFVTGLAPLPLNRVRDAAVFEITGVDFAGPLFLKGGEKAWVALFTCAVYRAVHLELCTSLSTVSFIQVLRRFIARRGRPKTIYSDNGTNFVGTDNCFEKLNWEQIRATCSVDRIEWRFNPPSASWWGGFWERMVGVLKQILRKVLGRASLTYEDLVTLLCDCEAVVNQRPLTYVSNDIKDLAPLTPMMFLRDLECTGVPDCDAVDAQSLCKRVLYKQKLRDDLRKRFRSEYLGQLKSWVSIKPGRQISLGEVILIGNDIDKRIQWPLGRVTELFPGKDGQIRLVRVHTSRGSLLRPVQRLYPLEYNVGKTVEAAEGVELVPVVDEQDVSNRGDDSKQGVKCVDEPAIVERVSRSGRTIKVPKKFL